MKKMKKKSLNRIQLYQICIIFAFLSFSASHLLFAMPENSYIVPLCRQFSKDLFDLSAKPYLSPTVQVVNATSNAGFFHSAYIPAKVNKPYFRLSGNFMLGSVPNSMKSFTPQIPTKPYNANDISKFAELTFFPQPGVNIKDTAGLINYFLQNILYTGIYVDKTIQVPKSAPTTLGDTTASRLPLPKEVMAELVSKHPLYPYLMLVPSAAELINNVIGSIPESYTLTKGGDLNTIIAGVPQLEIGSLYGTELLIRLIPPLDLGEWVGKFSFWGVGLKHSISQYFYYDNNRDGNAAKRNQITPFDLAVQVVFQKTGLENTVGITEAKLKANANIFNFNVHGSKNFNNYFELYTGLSFERTDITGSYTYYLPVEIQNSIGLMTVINGEIVADPENGYPGDTEPQKSDVSLVENQIKWIIGASKNIGPVTVYANYSVSKFNVFNMGLQYRF